MINIGQDPQFPAEEQLAEYFVSIAASSQRPKALLNSNSAALKCYFDALDQQNPVSEDIRCLIEGLVKSATAIPMAKSTIMPRQPFVTLFKGWPQK